MNVLTGTISRMAACTALTLTAAAALSAAAAHPAAAAITSGLGGPVVAVEDPGNSLDMFWQVNGTAYYPGQVYHTSLGSEAPAWVAAGVGFWRVADGGSTFSAPSVVNDGQSTLIAAQGANHSLDFYWSPDAYWWGAATVPHFTREVVAGPDTTYSAPQLIVADGRVDIVSAGPDDTLDFYSAASGQAFSPGTPATVIGGPGTTWSQPSIASDGYGLVVAALGLHGPVDVYWGTYAGKFGAADVIDPSVTGPASPFYSFSAPSVTAFGGWVTVVYQGSTASLAMWSALVNATRWYFGAGHFSAGSWVELPAPPTSGTIASAPQATWSQGYLDIAATGFAGDVSYWRMDASGMHFQVALKPGTSYGAWPTITPNNGGINIETQDSSGEVFYSWQRLGAPAWGQEQWSQAR
jgi:hypothetical protein